MNVLIKSKKKIRNVERTSSIALIYNHKYILNLMNILKKRKGWLVIKMRRLKSLLIKIKLLDIYEIYCKLLLAKHFLKAHHFRLG